jgi:hypothetical protein
MKRGLTMILLMVVAIMTNAQSVEFEDLKRFSPRSFGEIINDNTVQGYFYLEKLEKVSKKEAVFQITLMDDKLAETTSFEIRRPKKTYLLETVFNNEVFVFHFYDAKARTLDVVSIDRAGKQVGSYKVVDPGKYYLTAINSVIQTEQEYTTIYEIGSRGFMYIETVKNKDIGFVLHGLDNNMKETWSYATDPVSKLFESASVLSIDDQYALLMIMKKKSLASKKFDSFLMLVDTKTGDVKYNFQMQDNNEAQLSVLNGFVNDDSGEAFIVGEYYAPGDDVAKDKSMGLYIRGVETNGEYSVFKKYGWDSEVAKVKRSTMTEDEEKSNKKDVDLLYFHRIIRGENGNVYAIAEQFQKQFSAGGAAINVLAAASGSSSNVSAFELLVTNMVVLEFDKDLNMTDYEIIGKKKSNVLLPSGAGFYSAQMLGAYVQTVGGFDYGFTTEDKKANKHYTIYSDSNRKEDDDSGKSDSMIGVISISGDGEVESRRIPFNTGAKWFSINRAKTGYVLIQEYYRKDRKLVLRMEKVG